MMASFMRKLPNDKKESLSTYSQKDGETSSPTSNRRWKQEARLERKVMATWCNRQRKQLVMLQHRGTDTVMDTVSGKLHYIEKSAPSILPYPHFHRRRNGERPKKLEESQQELYYDRTYNDAHNDVNFEDVIDYKEIYQDAQDQLQPRPLSISDPILTTMEQEESKLGGSKVALFERATELRWIKKVFRRHRADDESPIEQMKNKGKKILIPPADFPNEDTMNICTLVDPLYYPTATVMTTMLRVNSNFYNNERAQLEVIGKEKEATEEHTIEDSLDADPNNFSAYCDEILFGGYIL
ncbi:hypothetical protein BDA99DRAFT_535486 [Phascolomyces articulosus]|uniref:Uncharacterized protein n=1 Tax=Phascolomyces articulosus TaxID=60185 RepID=A0AAD5KDJ6_9FUNG|nr:hypothetical protein BDA99DRAFT_535486 [Phascolomyces articulosus]